MLESCPRDRSGDRMPRSVEIGAAASTGRAGHANIFARLTATLCVALGATVLWCASAFAGPAATPVVEGEYVSDVSATSATLGASVNPGGSPTEYWFEYGTTASYGSRTAAVPLGEGVSLQQVQAHIQGLAAATPYHYRLVAVNTAGTTEGLDRDFTSQSLGGPLTLLDTRKWELVSPPVKYGAGITPQRHEGDVIEAAASGEAIAYIALNPIESRPEGNSAPEATEILARRSVGGAWTNRTMNTMNEEVHSLPVGNGTEYRMFSPEMTSAILEPFGNTPLAPSGTNERGPYLRDETACQQGSVSCFTPLLTREDTFAGAKWDPKPENALLKTRFSDATEDLRYSVIKAKVQLTEGAAKTGLYEWAEGHLENVSINAAGKSVAGELGGFGESDVRGALSSDGSRLFWCETECGAFGGPLYMRDTTTGETLRIDQEGDEGREFQIATADGSRVFYTVMMPGEPEVWHLWECAIVETEGKPSCERTEVAPEVEGMVIGMSSSGTTVYFVSTDVLAAGAEANGNNLYVSHLEEGKWHAHLVAALDPNRSGYEGDTVDWGAPNDELSRTMARVSPNGHYVAFMSDRSITGYDNRDAVSGEPDEEVFIYDDETGKLICPSCDRTGARPDGVLFEAVAPLPLNNSTLALDDRWVAASLPAWDNISLDDAIYQSRYLSNEGRLFFDSSDTLVSQDTNGVEDVYEYEPAGVGSCTGEGGGCVQLVSSGTSGEESAFLDAGEGGGDVFFMTTARLSAQDVDTEFDVYDAHVCTSAVPCVQAPTSSMPCANGESCKPAQTPQPTIYGAPGSATFSGAGNSLDTVGTLTKTSKPRSSKGGAKRRLLRALKKCKREHAHKVAKQRHCEAQARKRLGRAAKRNRRTKSRVARSGRAQNGQNGRGR